MKTLKREGFCSRDDLNSSINIPLKKFRLRRPLNASVRTTSKENQNVKLQIKRPVVVQNMHIWMPSKSSKPPGPKGKCCLRTLAM